MDPDLFWGDSCKPLKNMAEMTRLETHDLCRDSVTVLGFTITYKTAGTAKVRGRHARRTILWVRLWVENEESGVHSVGCSSRPSSSAREGRIPVAPEGPD